LFNISKERNIQNREEAAKSFITHPFDDSNGTESIEAKSKAATVITITTSCYLDELIDIYEVL
jgi:hypothetical protein